MAGLTPYSSSYRQPPAYSSGPAALSVNNSPAWDVEGILPIRRRAIVPADQRRPRRLLAHDDGLGASDNVVCSSAHPSRTGGPQSIRQLRRYLLVRRCRSRQSRFQLSNLRWSAEEALPRAPLPLLGSNSSMLSSSRAEARASAASSRLRTLAIAAVDRVDARLRSPR